MFPSSLATLLHLAFKKLQMISYYLLMYSIFVPKNLHHTLQYVSLKMQILYFAAQSGKSRLLIAAGCGLPPCRACFDWDRGVGLPHISFSSLRGINHPVKSRQFYSVVCESAYNPHNSTAHFRPMYPNVQLNKRKSLQLGIPPQLQWPKPSFCRGRTFSLIKPFQFSLCFRPPEDTEAVNTGAFFKT